MQLKSRSNGYAKRLLRVPNWLARWLRRLDTRRFLVVYDKGAIVQLCDVGVELARELKRAGLVGLFLLLVELASSTMRVELIIGIEQLADFPIQRSHDRADAAPSAYSSSTCAESRSYRLTWSPR